MHQSLQFMVYVHITYIVRYLLQLALYVYWSLCLKIIAPPPFTAPLQLWDDAKQKAQCFPCHHHHFLRGSRGWITKRIRKSRWTSVMHLGGDAGVHLIGSFLSFWWGLCAYILASMFLDIVEKIINYLCLLFFQIHFPSHFSSLCCVGGCGVCCSLLLSNHSQPSSRLLSLPPSHMDHQLHSGCCVHSWHVSNVHLHLSCILHIYGIATCL